MVLSMWLGMNLMLNLYQLVCLSCDTVSPRACKVDALKRTMQWKEAIMICHIT